MAISRITATSFADIIAEGINNRDATVDTQIGAVRDIIVDPVADVLEQQNNRVVYLNNLMTLKNAGKVVPDDLDDIVFNEGIERWTGARSTVVLTFSRAQAPTADYTIPTNYPVSTIVDLKTGLSVDFRTIESKTMYSASASSYYNATTGKYELEVQAASIITGSEAQVGAYTITQPKRPLLNFDEVFNASASTSGRALETNEELADRYLLHIKGSQLGTPDGIKSFVLDNFASVDDAYVVYGNSDYLTREDDDAGAVDVWLKGSTPATKTYVTVYPGTETLIPLDRQPLISITSVTSTYGGGTTFTEGTDYEVVTGETEYSYSNVGTDGIKFIAGGSHPNIADDLTITYQYNSLISTVDAYFKQPAFYSLGMDKLYRWAQAVPLDIEVDLKVKSGSPSYIRESLKNAWLTYINNLKLGDDVEEFDLDAQASQIVGIDNLTWVTLAELGGSGVADIEIGPNNYASLEESNLVINIV